MFEITNMFDINLIFDPFFTTKDVGQETGLGLGISFNIVPKKHMGVLSLDKKTNNGAAFTFKLPKAENEQKEVTENA